jgi:hypothetical protein
MDDGILDENLDALIGCQVVSYTTHINLQPLFHKVSIHLGLSLVQFCGPPLLLG